MHESNSSQCYKSLCFACGEHMLQRSNLPESVAANFRQGDVLYLTLMALVQCIVVTAVIPKVLRFFIHSCF